MPKPDQHDDAPFKPTPTQEENDLAALGLTPLEKEPDGSQPPPPEPEGKRK